MEQKGKQEFLINFSFGAIIFIIAFFTAKFTFKYLTPFVFAVIIASVMQKPAEFINKKTGFKKQITAAILTVGVYLIFGALLSFIIYGAIFLISELILKMPNLINSFSEFFSVLEVKFDGILNEISPETTQEILSVIKETTESFILRLSGIFSSFAASAAKNIPSFFISSIVALVASCYIAKDYDKLKKFLIGLMSQKIYKNIIKIRGIVNKSVLKIIKGYLLLFLMTFIELTVGFLILKIKFAPIIAFIVAFVDFLPVLGTGIVIVPWGLVSIIMGDTYLGFALIVIYIITLIVRNFAEPKIIGEQMGINPLFTLFSMFLGLKLMGFWGLLLFPVTLIVTIQFYKNDSSEVL